MTAQVIAGQPRRLLHAVSRYLALPAEPAGMAASRRARRDAGLPAQTHQARHAEVPWTEMARALFR